jgi:hypothetical protein
MMHGQPIIKKCLFVCIACGIFNDIIFSLHELIEVAATDFVTGIVVMHHVLVQRLGDSWRVVNSFTHATRILATGSSSVSTQVL